MSCSVSQKLAECHTNSRGVCLGECDGCGEHLQRHEAVGVFCQKCDACIACGHVAAHAYDCPAKDEDVCEEEEDE